MVFGTMAAGWLVQYAIFPICFFMIMQGLMQALAPVKFFENAPFAIIKKQIAPHVKALVGSDQAYVKGIVAIEEGGATKEQLTKGLISMLIHIMRLFGVMNVTIGGFGVFIGIAVGNGNASSWTAWAFILTFYATFVGFQLIHVYQPFPGEPKFFPCLGIAIASAIIAPILVLDPLLAEEAVATVAV